MVKYLKEYGITTIEYEYIIHNLNQEVLDLISLSESSVREVLEFYNSIGLYEEISNIIINRPDLILTSLNELGESIKKITPSVFTQIIRSNIDNLILLGI